MQESLQSLWQKQTGCRLTHTHAHMQRPFLGALLNFLSALFQITYYKFRNPSSQFLKTSSSPWVTYGSHISGPPKDCASLKSYFWDATGTWDSMLLFHGRLNLTHWECLVPALQFPFCPLVLILTFTVLSPSAANSSCHLLRKNFFNICHGSDKPSLQVLLRELDVPG